MALAANAARAAEPVPYLDWDPTTSNLVERTCSAYELVTSTTREFADGKWYVVADTVVIDNGGNIKVNGSVGGALTVGDAEDSVGRIVASNGAKVAKGGSVTLLGGPMRGTFTTLSPGLTLLLK